MGFVDAKTSVGDHILKRTESHGMSQQTAAALLSCTTRNKNMSNAQKSQLCFALGSSSSLDRGCPSPPFLFVSHTLALSLVANPSNDFVSVQSQQNLPAAKVRAPADATSEAADPNSRARQEWLKSSRSSVKVKARGKRRTMGEKEGEQDRDGCA